MITLTLNCESIEQLREEIGKFLNGTASHIAHVSPAKVEPQQAATAQELQVEKTVEAAPTQALADAKPFDLEVQKKRTRRTKEQIEADKLAKTGGKDVFSNGATDHAPEAKAVEEVKLPPAPSQPAAPSSGLSRQAVHEALQQVNATAGLPKSREILQSFGAGRISEIKEDQFKAFVDKCNEAVMQS